MDLNLQSVVSGFLLDVFWNTCKNASHDVDLVVTRVDLIIDRSLDSYQSGSDMTSLSIMDLVVIGISLCNIR